MDRDQTIPFNRSFVSDDLSASSWQSLNDRFERLRHPFSRGQLLQLMSAIVSTFPKIAEDAAPGRATRPHRWRRMVSQSPKAERSRKRCASPAINLPQLPVFPGFRFGFIFRESTLAMWPASRVSCHKECGFLVPNRKHGPSAQLSMAAKEFPFTLPTPVWRIEDQAQPAHAIIPPCSEPACSL